MAAGPRESDKWKQLKEAGREGGRVCHLVLSVTGRQRRPCGRTGAEQKASEGGGGGPSHARGTRGTGPLRRGR